LLSVPSLIRRGDTRKCSPPFDRRRFDSSWKQRLDRALGEINVLLVALAIGLAVLDATCFVAFTTIAEIRRANGSSQQVRLSVPQSRPQWLQFPPTPAPAASVTGQKMGPL